MTFVCCLSASVCQSDVNTELVTGVDWCTCKGKSADNCDHLLMQVSLLASDNWHPVAHPDICSAPTCAVKYNKASQNIAIK